MKNKKKGFTLVELLVVIAILAILATVSVVGYLAFTEKAKESNDISLTTQMNTVLQANEAQDKAETMSDVASQLDEAGLDIEKLTPTSSGYSFVWDKETNRIFLLDEEKKVVSPEGASLSDNTENIMAIVHDGDELNTWTEANYGVYLASGFPTTELPDTLNKAVSFDAGELTLDEITISFSDNKDIYIAGNYDTLTISAASAGVDFYGDATFVNATVANESLHVYGHIQELTMTQGRVVVEANSEINTIKASDNATSIIVESNSTSAVIGGILDTNNKINNKVQGVQEVTEANDSFAGGLGTESSPFLISSSEEFTNINSLYSSKTKEGNIYTGDTYYFKQINNIELIVPKNGSSVLSFFTGKYDANNYSISFQGEVSDYAYLFGLIFNDFALSNLNYELNSNQPISLVYSTDWLVDKGDILFENINITSEGVVLSNSTNFSLFNCFAIQNFSSLKYVNCVNNAHLNNRGTSTGVFMGSGPILYNNDNSSIEYVNCVNNGNITGGNQVGVLYGNGAYVGIYDIVSNDKISNDYNDRISVENLINNGTIVSVLDSGVASIAPRSKFLVGKYQNSNNSYIIGGYFYGKDIYLSQSDYVYSINDNNSDILFEVAFNINTLDNSDSNTVSNTTKYFYSVSYQENISNNSILKHMAYDLQKAKEVFGEEVCDGFTFDENGIEFYVVDGTTYLIFENKKIGRNNPSYKTPGECAVVVYVYAYDKTGACVGVKTIK